MNRYRPDFFSAAKLDCVDAPKLTRLMPKQPLPGSLAGPGDVRREEGSLFAAGDFLLRAIKNPLAGFGAGERICLATTIEGTTKKTTLVPADSRHDIRGDSRRSTSGAIDHARYASQCGFSGQGF